MTGRRKKSTATSVLCLKDKLAFIKRRMVIPNNLSSKVLNLGLVVGCSIFLTISSQQNTTQLRKKPEG